MRSKTLTGEHFNSLANMLTMKVSSVWVGGGGSILEFQKQIKFCIFAKLELMETLQGVIWVAECSGETSFLTDYNRVRCLMKKKDIR